MRLIPTLRGRPGQLIRNPFARPVLAGLAIAAVIGAGSLMHKMGVFDLAVEAVSDKTYQVTRTTGLRLEDIFVEGRERTSLEDLRIAVGLKPDAALLFFSPQTVRERIEALPWVQTAHVERRLPDTVYIRIEERHPLVIWQDEGRFAVVDTTGHVIPASMKEIKQLEGLPLVVGHQAPEQAREFLEILKSQPALAEHVKAGVRVGMRRWDIVTVDGIAIQLPELNPHKAWARLASYQNRHEVLARDLEAIDMRLPDRIVVRTAKPETFRKPVAGQDT